MSDDSTETESETDSITLDDAMQFGADSAEREADSFENEMPDHAAEMIASRATDLLQTQANNDMMRAAEGIDDPDDEPTMVEEDAVDILMAVAALQYEYDIDIATAFQDRMDFMEDFRQFQQAMEDADSEQEKIEAMDEHLTDEIEERMGISAPNSDDDGGFAGNSGMGSVEPGDNVDGDDYDHDEEDKSFA